MTRLPRILLTLSIGSFTASLVTAQSTVEIHEDVTACFESVTFGSLQRGAGSHGYPMGLLRLSVSSYVWPRRIKLGPIA